MSSLPHLSAHASLTQRPSPTTTSPKRTALATHATAKQTQKITALAREYASQIATSASYTCTSLPSTSTPTTSPPSTYAPPSPPTFLTPICCRDNSPTPSSDTYSPPSHVCTPTPQHPHPSPSPTHLSTSTYSPPSRISTPTPSTLQQHLTANAANWAAIRDIYVENARFEIGRLTTEDADGAGEDGEGNTEAIQAVMRRLGEKLEWAGAGEREEAMGLRRLWG